jgi:hypothetical protein
LRSRRIRIGKFGGVYVAGEPGHSIDGGSISGESMRRIAAALKKTLKEELVKECKSGNAEPVLDGPWRMLASECGGWSTQAHISPELYAQMRGLFSDDVTREVLLAAAGVKISRTCLSDANLEVLRGICGQHGLRLLASEERYIHRQDTGKGGASNRIEQRAAPGDETGLRNVYIASGANVVEVGKLLEEAGDDEVFGTLLGIPTCCREAYARFKPQAMAKQNDFLPLVLDNTVGAVPYDPWLNYLSQYFGRTLISFFPCSLRCPAAAMVARITFGMLAECDRAWAQSFLDLQRTNIVYTEYEGLHMFRRSFAEGSIQYGPNDFDSTEPTSVSDLLRRGDRLDVRGKRCVHVYRGSDRIGALEGEDVGMCVFR